LNPFHVKRIIDSLAPRMIGFDVVEVSPPLDNGVTSILAARLVANVVAATHATSVNWNA